MKTPARCAAFLACALLTLSTSILSSQSNPAATKPQLVLLDTDIGDDIDDAFALSLLLQSPEVKLLGISTAYGDTELRAQLVDRFLHAAGRADIPVAAGVRTATPPSNIFTQAAYAHRQPLRKHPDGVAFLLSQIRRHPNQVTLLAIGPLSNIRAAIAQDAATFHKLKRVVIMGGSVYRGYGKPGTPPQVEWNAGQDSAGLKALLASGVSTFVMPLDSTQIPLTGDQQDKIFAFGSPLTDQVTLLYHQWKYLSGWHPTGPVLYDPMTVAFALKPELCPMQPMNLAVDAKGMTLPGTGTPNAQVCVKADEQGFLNLLQDRLAPAQK